MKIARRRNAAKYHSSADVTYTPLEERTKSRFKACRTRLAAGARKDFKVLISITVFGLTAFFYNRFRKKSDWFIYKFCTQGSVLPGKNFGLQIM